MEPVRVEFLMVDGMSARLTQAGRKVDTLKGKAKEASTAMDGLDKASEKVRQALSKLAAAFTAKELVSKIANVRGEFQQLEVAFRTMLGSEEKANDLMAQLVKTAATTPFDLQGVANGAKQLLAYGENVANVNDDLIRLGNIAAGLSQPLGDIVYLYGTTMTQGRLYTQDLNQFTGRGIPMIRELANVLGIAEDKVKEAVEAGKVGFPEVQKVIQNLTNEGGMFYNLMEEQSKTITGQISNIEDAISTMFNEIGQQNEGVINTALSGVSSLVENYEQVGRVLVAVAATYGTYKTAVMLATAAEGWATAAEAIHYNWLLLLEKAQKLLNKTMLANPYVLVATAVATLVGAMWSMQDSTTAAEAAQRSMNDTLEEARAKQEEYNRETQNAISKAQDEALSTNERRDAMNMLIQRYPTIIKKYIDEEGHLTKIAELKREIAELDGKKTTATLKKDMEADQTRLTFLQNLKKMGRGASDYLHKKGNEKLLNWYKSLEQRALPSYNGRSALSIEELISFYTKRTSLKKEAYGRNQTEQKVKSFQESMSEMTSAEIDALIKELTTATGNVKGHKATYVSSLKDYLTSSDIESLKVTAEGIKAARGKGTGSSEDWGNAARKKYQDALKAYNDFVKNPNNNLTQGEYEKEAKRLKTELDEAKKSYEATKPSEDKDATKADKQKAKDQRAEERRKQALTDLGEKERALELENQEEEIELMDEGREKKLKQIDKEYQQRAAEIEKKAHDLAEANKKAGETNVNDNGLTKEQQTEIDKANELNEKNRAKQESDLVKADAEAMREYLKQYGTYQQQKLAIAEEYAEKIKKAESEGEKKTLEAERDSALQTVEVNAIKQSVDWGSVFGDFGTMFKDQLQPTIEKLRAIAGSDSFKASSLEDQQALYELIAKLEQSGATWDSDIFKKVGSDITAYQNAMKGYNAALEREKTATDALTTAKERLASAETGEDKTAAQQAVDAAQAALDAASADVKTFGSQVAETTESLQSSSEKAKNMFENLASGLEGLASGSLKGVGQGVMTLDKLFGGDVTKTAGNALAKGFQGLLGKDSAAAKAITEALGDTGLAGEIISAVLGMLDLIAEQGISGIITSLQDTILGSVNGILNDVLSGDIITKPLKNAVTGVGSILDTVTFGGFSSLFGNGDSDKHLAEDMERLSATNEALQFAIEELTSVMEDAATKDVASMYEQQTALLDESEANMREQMSRTGAAYSNGVLGIGGHKSSNHKINEGTSGTDWSRISQIVGRQIDSAGDWWSLTSEEMRKVATDAPDLYAKIKDLANDGYKDAAQYMDTYIEFAEQREELEEAYYEKLTGFSLDSLREEFKDFLTDATMSWSDMSENFNEILVDSIAEALMTDKYDPMIKALYEKWAKFMEDGVLTEEEQAELQADKEAILESMKTDRASLSSIDTGSGTSQTGKSGSFTTMTQDQGTKLEGMFTSGLQHWSSMDTRMEDVAAKMDLAEGHLAKIEENTGVSASHLNEIKEDLKKVIRDGLKMK